MERWSSAAYLDSLVASGWAGSFKRFVPDDTQMGRKLLQGMILVTFVAWILLVMLPLAFPKMTIISPERLSTVSLMLTTLIGLGLGPEVYHRMKNGKNGNGKA